MKNAMGLKDLIPFKLRKEKQEIEAMSAELRRQFYEDYVSTLTERAFLKFVNADKPHLSNKEKLRKSHAYSFYQEIRQYVESFTTGYTAIMSDMSGTRVDFGM